MSPVAVEYFGSRVVSSEILVETRDNAIVTFRSEEHHRELPVPLGREWMVTQSPGCEVGTSVCLEEGREGSVGQRDSGSRVRETDLMGLELRGTLQGKNRKSRVEFSGEK